MTLTCGYCYYCSLPFFNVGVHQSKCKYLSDSEENIKARRMELRKLEISVLKNNAVQSVDGKYLNITKLFPNIQWLGKVLQLPCVKDIVTSLQYKNTKSGYLECGIVWWHNSLVLMFVQQLSPQYYVDILDVVMSHGTTRLQSQQVVTLSNKIEQLTRQINWLIDDNTRKLDEIHWLKMNDRSDTPIPYTGVIVKPPTPLTVEEKENKAELKRINAIQKRNEKTKKVMEAYKAQQEWLDISEYRRQVDMAQQDIYNYMGGERSVIKDYDTFYVENVGLKELRKVTNNKLDEWESKYGETYFIENETVTRKIPLKSRKKKPPSELDFSSDSSSNDSNNSKDSKDSKDSKVSRSKTKPTDYKEPVNYYYKPGERHHDALDTQGNIAITRRTETRIYGVLMDDSVNMAELDDFEELLSTSPLPSYAYQDYSNKNYS